MINKVFYKFGFKILYLSFFIYALPFVIIVIIIFNDINLSGTRIYRYYFTKPVSTISPLFPAQRLMKIDRGQQLIIQPVYFTVYYPHRYQTATIMVNVHNPRFAAWKLGIKVRGNNDWSYYFKDPDSDGIVVFDLRSVEVVNRKIRFIIAIDDFQTADYFKILSIKAILSRPSLLNIIFRKT